MISLGQKLNDKRSMTLRMRFQSREESHFTKGETEIQESQINNRAIQFIGNTTVTSILFSVTSIQANVFPTKIIVWFQVIF